MTVSPILKGFRTQFLYTLYRISIEKDVEIQFQPEGLEDLDIIKQGRRKELIQVKNYSSKLKYENLFSKGGTTSFYQRILDEYNNNHDIKATIVSFGEFDDNLIDPTLIRKKLESSFKISDSKILSRLINCKSVSEEQLILSIKGLLKGRFPGYNPTIGITYLLQWIYESAEKHNAISIIDFNEQIDKIETFIGQQDSFHSRFGKDIISISNYKLDDIGNLKSLSEEYYSGISARYYNILADNDYPRVQYIKEISECFKSSNIVIVHGASGEGKSSLAYRYIYTWHNEYMAYEIQNIDSNNFGNIIASVDSMITDVNLPVLFYVDIQPSDIRWTNFIKAFANHKNIRLLVTIRQEDWNSSKSQIDIFAFYKDIHLSLTKDEALNIYKLFKEKNNIKFNTFHEIWESFCHGEHMLEFIYLLTHGENLSNKIKSQIESLQKNKEDDIIHVLAHLSIADNFGAQISKKELRNADIVDACNFEFVMKKISGEYFNIDKENNIKGLHPIRSKLIMENIFGNDNEEIVNQGLKTFDLIGDDSLFIYILNLFNLGLTNETILKFLSSYKYKSPIQVYSILKALLWKGVFDYKEKNEKNYTELKTKFGKAVNLFISIPINFTEIDILSSLEKIPNIDLLTIKNITNKFSKKEEIFNILGKWLNSSNIVLYPKTSKEYNAVGEIFYYCSYITKYKIELKFDINGTSYIDWNIEDLATILLGLKSSSTNKKEIPLLESVFIEKIREQYNILKLSISDEECSAISFIDYNNKVQTGTKEQTGTYIEITNNNIAELFRRAFPNKKVYNSEIIKDYISGILSKDIPLEKHISRENIPLKEMQVMQSYFVGLLDFDNAVINEKEYVTQILNSLNQYKIVLDELCNVFCIFIRNKKDGIKEINARLENDKVVLFSPDIYKPKTQFSKWGLGANIKQNDDSAKDAFNKFNRIMTDFFNSILNFVRQYIDALNVILNSTNDDSSIKNIATYNLRDGVKQYELFKESFNSLFPELINDNNSLMIENTSKSLYNVWLAWETIIRDLRIEGSKVFPRLTERFSKFSNFPSKFANDISKELKSIGIDNNVLIENKILKIRFGFTNSFDYNTCIYNINNILVKNINNKDKYSTQRLILEINIDSVSLIPYYITEDKLPIDNLSYSILFGSLENANADEIPSILPQNIDCISWVQKDKNIEEFQICKTIIETVNIYINQINNIKGYNLNIDIIGRKIYDKYVQKINNIIKELDFSVFDKVITKLEKLPNDSNIDLMITIINYCKGKVQKIIKDDKKAWDSDENWGGIIDYFNNKFLEIQIQLLSNHLSFNTNLS